MRTGLVALLLLSCAASAKADEPGLRPRWGFGLVGGFDQTHSPDPRASDAVGLGPGVFTRGGIQLNDLYDLELDLSLGTILFSNFVRAALNFGYSWEWLTVSGGPVIAYHSDGMPGGGASATYAAVSLRLDYHFARHVTESGLRWDVVASLAGELGRGLSQESCCRIRAVEPGTSWGVYTSIGPSWY